MSDPLVLRWARARRALLVALQQNEEYTKQTKGGREVVQPLPAKLTDLWTELSNAEWALFDSVKEEIDGQ